MQGDRACAVCAVRALAFFCFQVLDCNLTALLTLGLGLIYSREIKMPVDGTQEYGASFSGVRDQ